MTWRLNRVRYLNVTFVPKLKLDLDLDLERVEEHAETGGSRTRVVRAYH